MPVKIYFNIVGGDAAGKNLLLGLEKGSNTLTNSNSE